VRKKAIDKAIMGAEKYAYPCRREGGNPSRVIVPMNRENPVLSYVVPLGPRLIPDASGAGKTKSASFLRRGLSKNNRRGLNAPATFILSRLDGTR